MTDRLEQIWEDLKTQRDELRVQVHLATADLADELEALEPKWNSARDKFEDLKEETEEAAEEVRQALNIIAEELSTAYRNIKARLKHHS